VIENIFYSIGKRTTGARVKNRSEKREHQNNNGISMLVVLASVSLLTVWQSPAHSTGTCATTKNVEALWVLGANNGLCKVCELPEDFNVADGGKCTSCPTTTCKCPTVQVSTLFPRAGLCDAIAFKASPIDPVIAFRANALSFFRLLKLGAHLHAFYTKAWSSYS
jgi:hypothetical protein